MLSEHSSSSLTLTTSRFGNHVRLHCGDLFVFFTVELFDVYRLEDSHMHAAAALLALAALPPVLAEAATATVLAPAALSPVLAKASFAAALLTLAALPSVLADAATAAVLAVAGLPPVLAEAAAATVLAPAALSSVLAKASFAAAVFASAALPSVLADAATAAVLALATLPAMRTAHCAHARAGCVGARSPATRFASRPPPFQPFPALYHACHCARAVRPALSLASRRLGRLRHGEALCTARRDARRLRLAQSKLAAPGPTEWPRPPSEWPWDGGTISSS